MIPVAADDGAWLAPAKLNLMLRVVGRRADGYHRLQTVFQFIDHCDRLYLERRYDGSVVRRRGAAGVPPERDLVVRAATALQAWSGCTSGVSIDVHKSIPLGGGLGGGSSNAATVLVALNQLWGLGLDTDALAAIGLRLGADVPVFVHGQAAWAEGVGECLTPVELPEPWYLVLVPSVSVSTATIFSAPELTRDSRSVILADFLAGIDGNDCLATVLGRYPEVAAAFGWLERHAGGGRLTGTGGCVFAVCESEDEARVLKSSAPARFSAFIARGFNRSPLFGAARNDDQAAGQR